LALGGKLLGTNWRVHAVSYSGNEQAIRAMEVDLARRVADLLDLPAALSPGDFDVHDEYVGGRYAATPPTTLEAIKLAARTDAIFMDPVYTGKSFSGLVGEVRAGRVPREDIALFVHTGGLPIIFAYHEVLKGL
jgi:1-aminocyclopropane-1-carboxylate deaminase/D-cysteine desulfhydrase-like pyridoxal-dependent ACC family enzyme